MRCLAPKSFDFILMLVSVTIFVTAPAFAQSKCEKLFSTGAIITAPTKIQFYKLQEAEFIELLQQFLTPPKSESELLQATAAAEKDVQSLESALGQGRIPEDQRKTTFFNALRVRGSDNFLMTVNGPDSTGLSKGWAVDSFATQVAPEQAFYGKLFKVPLVDFWYKESLANYNLSFEKIDINPQSIYSQFIGVAPREWNSYQSTKSTLRVLERSPEQPTVIEIFLKMHQLQSQSYFNLIEKSAEQNKPVFELGRVSNATGNPKVLTAHRLLLAYYVLRSKPDATLVLSANSPKLVSYYERWGFTKIDEISVDSSKTYYLMSTDAHTFTEHTLTSMKAQSNEEN